MSHRDASIKALLARAPELRRDALIRQARARRRGTMLQLRRAYEAHMDARLVFRAASEGQPLELQRKLVLGKLAGGASTARITPTGHRVTPLAAATAGGHEDCAKLLRGAISYMKSLRDRRDAIGALRRNSRMAQLHDDAVWGCIAW